jgi:hypothetical protein
MKGMNTNYPIRAAVMLVGMLLAVGALAQTKETHMTLHAHGTFEVKTQPLPSAPGDGMGRFSLEKQIHGDLEGVSKGEMLTAGDYTKGEAGYVALEQVTGSLKGRRGSFVLQHVGTMDKSGMTLRVTVVPGSGTDQLQGIAGSFTITITAGQHSYDFDYTLPETTSR